MLCGVSIITKRYAVSAAHCILNNAETGYEAVGAQGQTQVTMKCPNHDITNAGCTKLDVKRLIPHPCYVPSSADDNDDIMLLEFYTDAPLTDSELPHVDGQNGRIMTASGYLGCLYNSALSVKLLGWGTTSSGYVLLPLMLILKHGAVVLILTYCLLWMSHCSHSPNAVKQNLMLCLSIRTTSTIFSVLGVVQAEIAAQAILVGLL